MDNYSELISKLKNLLHDDSIKPETCNADMNGVSFLQLRDAILTIGDVLEEDEENQIYVAAIKAGLWKMGRAYVAARIVDGVLFIAAYAKEGLINQHMADSSAKSLVDLLKKNATDQPKREVNKKTLKSK